MHPADFSSPNPLSCPGRAAGETQTGDSRSKKGERKGRERKKSEKEQSSRAAAGNTCAQGPGRKLAVEYYLGISEKQD